MIVIYHAKGAKGVLDSVFIGVMNVPIVVLVELLVVKVQKRNTCHHFICYWKVHWVWETEAIRLVEKTDNWEGTFGSVNAFVKVVFIKDIEQLEMSLYGYIAKTYIKTFS